MQDQTPSFLKLSGVHGSSVSARHVKWVSVDLLPWWTCCRSGFEPGL